MKNKRLVRWVGGHSRFALEELELRRLLSNATLYVDSRATGNKSGSSWTNAFTDLQSALSSSSLTGTGNQILVAQGTYKPTATTNRAISFQLKSGVAVLGGYQGIGATDPTTRSPSVYVTTLSGDIGTVGSNTDNSYHVVVVYTLSAAATLDGFTITGGNANLNTYPNQYGGGVYVNSSNLTISNCTFTANTAVAGGGLYNDDASPAITNCTFSSNSATGLNDQINGGGGVFNSFSGATFTSCTFNSNSARNGAGMQSFECTKLTVTGCTFSSNQGTIGGGMDDEDSTPKISNCTFSGNVAQEGAGVCDIAASSTVTNCTFIGNTMTSSGGSGVGMSASSNSNPNISNCSFTNNSGTSYGGGLYIDTTATTSQVSQCTFTGNTLKDYRSEGAGAMIEGGTVTGCTFTSNIVTAGAGGGGGGGLYAGYKVNVANCTFLKNSATAGGGLFLEYASGTFTNCIIEGSLGDGAGVVTEEAEDPTLENCVIVGNTGGGIYNGTYSQLTAINCTIVANVTDLGYSAGIFDNEDGGNPQLIAESCIVWGNTPAGEQQINDTLYSEVSDCDVQGGFVGTGNINADPAFVRTPSIGADNKWGTADDDYGDLRLKSTSPCIDAGNNSDLPSGDTTDAQGLARTIDIVGVHDPGAIVDLGAYERQLSSSISGGSFTYNSTHPAMTFNFSNAITPSSLQSGDPTLQNLTTGKTIDCSTIATVSYSSTTCSASWAFTTAIPDGNYQVTLPAAAVQDANGGALPASYTYRFFSLTADANHDRTVNALDFNALATNYGKVGTFTQGDFDYSGTVDSNDFALLASRYGTVLAPPAGSALPASSAKLAVHATSLASSPVGNLFADQPIGNTSDILQ